MTAVRRLRPLSAAQHALRGSSRGQRSRTPVARCEAYRLMFQEALPADTLTRLRSATGAGEAVGDSRFRAAIESARSRSLTPCSSALFLMRLAQCMRGTKGRFLLRNLSGELAATVPASAGAPTAASIRLSEPPPPGLYALSTHQLVWSRKLEFLTHGGLDWLTRYAPIGSHRLLDLYLSLSRRAPYRALTRQHRHS